MDVPAKLALVLLVSGVMTTVTPAQEYRYPSATTAQNAAASTSTDAAPAPAAPTPSPAAAPGAATTAPACSNCGIVEAIRITEKAGEGSVLGMIAGGVLGGLLGHQVGQGSGNTAATIVGAAGGAYAGNQVEKKNMKKALQYEVSVRMDDGSLRTVTYDAEPGFRSGDKVRFIDGRLTRS